MQKKRIFMAGTLYPPTMEKFEKRYEVYRLNSPEALNNIPADWRDGCDVVVTNSGKGIGREVLERLPGLKLVANFGTGVDKIDLDCCREKGIRVTHTPGVLTEDVADLTMALILSTLRQVAAADRFVRRGDWGVEKFQLTRSLRGLHVGIVGMGQIGREVARLCLAFNTDIGYYGPNRKPVDYRYFEKIEDLAGWSDVLVAACPGGESTRGIISAGVLDRLGADGIFVNIARGSVVDEDALVARLVDGSLGGAGLDVFANEPEVVQQLKELDNVVLQPHLGSATVRTRTEMGNLTFANVAAWFAGEPLLTPVPGTA
jgi:hydroxypyruvate reductase